MIKNDAVQRGLVHKVIIKLESRGFKLTAMKLCQPGKAHFEEHYAEHKGKSFFEPLVGRMISGPVVAMVWEGDDVIATSRKMIGATDPSAAAIGTFRGDFGISKQRNGFHGSDSVEAADREISLWFKPEEVTQFDNVSEAWLYEEPTKSKKPASLPSCCVPKLELEEVTNTPTEEKAEGQMSSARKAGYVAATAIGAAAVIGGVLLFKK